MTAVSNLAELREILNLNDMSLMVVKAPWCGVCKLMQPVIDQLERENPDVKFVYVNADDSPDIVDEYGTKSLPAFVLFEGENEVVNMFGGMPKPQLQAKIDKLKHYLKE